MESPRVSEQSDFEVLYKQHVHDNLILHGGLRSLDSLKRNKLRELERNQAAFKSKFSKYAVKLPRPRSEFHYLGDLTPKTAVGKPSFVVCKTSPCSLKTWNNLTDVSREGIDIYKTDVLKSDEEAASFRRNDKRSLLPPVRAVSDENIPERNLNSTVLSDKSFHLGNLSRSNTQEDLKLPGFRERASTMPSYCYQRKPHETVGLENIRVMTPSRAQTKIHDAVKANESPKCQTPTIEITESEQTERKSEVSDAPTLTGNYRADPDSAENGLRRSLQKSNSVSVDASSTQGKRSFRPRSNTIDITKLRALAQSAGHRKLLPDRENLSWTKTESLGSVLRRMSLFRRLASAGLPPQENDSDCEDNCLTNYDEISKCRYLRVPGQNIYGSIEEISLENVDFEHNAVDPKPKERERKVLYL